MVAPATQGLVVVGARQDVELILSAFLDLENRLVLHVCHLLLLRNHRPVAGWMVEEADPWRQSAARHPFFALADEKAVAGFLHAFHGNFGIAAVDAQHATVARP